MSDSERTRLVESCASLNIELSDSMADLLLAYLDLLYFWNRSAGLTSVERRQALRRHLVDSLTLVEDLRDMPRIVDVGTGGGTPGIPLAIVLRDLEVSLVESKRRKCSFLHEVVRQLDLKNCKVLERDANTLEAGACCFDAVVSRAFMPPPEWLRFAAPLVGPGGRVLVSGGPECDVADVTEVGRALGLVLKAERSLALPGGGELRRILRFERPGPT